MGSVPCEFEKPVLTNIEQVAFSTENNSAFAAFQPKLKETGIFIDRFFHRFSYKDLAIKYETSASNAIKLYHHAVTRILEVVKALDSSADRKMDGYLRRVQTRSGSLPKGQKWYLLNKLFGLRPSEIAEMEGLDKRNSSVRQLIIRVKQNSARPNAHPLKNLQKPNSGRCIFGDTITG
jgi:hypothetical protein